MNDFRMTELERLVREAGATSPSPHGLRERTIAKAVAARSLADRDSRLGLVLSAATLTILLAVAVCKHAPLAGVVPASINMRPTVIHWERSDEPEPESQTSTNESREWKQVKRTSTRRHEVAQVFARCFGS